IALANTPEKLTITYEARKREKGDTQSSRKKKHQLRWPLLHESRRCRTLSDIYRGGFILRE
ncbi:521_t:CDS:2, partial [Dentiscutata erythropus]